MEPVIEFRDFSFKYRTQAEPTLRNISFSVFPGEKILIAGPSGSGKSTISRCINALIPATYEGEATGSLSVCGLDPAAEGVFGMARHVGTVLQDTDGQFIGLTVAEDIAFALENDAVPRKEMRSRVQQAAELVGMEGFLKNAPRSLSGGQKQRVSLAGVLVDDVDILLFDEPLANLDPAAGQATIELISNLQKTVIIIEHRLEDVLWRDVDRIIVMGEGRIVADMKPADLLATDVLRAQGIREPLHLAALRMAGCHVQAADNPVHVEQMNLDAHRGRIISWYESTEPLPESPPGKTLLSFEDVTFSYPVPAEGMEPREALSHVSFSVHEGEMLGIAGKNGAGKTTLSSLILGFIAPSAGRILFDGQDIAPLSVKERGERIGLVMQNPNQMISKPLLFDEVALGLAVRRVDGAEIERRVNEALTVCGLYPFRHWPVNALSFGQRKRVTIASILVLNPKVIILDEPTAGQDWRHYTEIMEFLRTLNSERGITIIMITHDMHLMLEYADRSLVLADGKLVADDLSFRILSDDAVTRQASLKKTSLYTLAVRLGISDTDGFIRRFIQCERKEGHPWHG